VVRRTAPMTGQLAFDDCTPDWPEPEPPARQRSAGTRYYPGPRSDLRGQRLRTSRIVTIPIVGEEYL
jgi:hypothetical protein